MTSRDGRAALEDLPHLDEHEVVAAAPPDAVWRAVLAGFGGLERPAARRYGRLVGAVPRERSGEPGRPGSTLPGFAVVEAEPPHRLVLAGRHRFARYGIVVRIDPVPAGTRCRLESRARFPGPAGGLYRLAVVGSGAHVVVVRRMLRRIAARAQRSG